MFKQFHLLTICALLAGALPASAGTLASPANVRSGPTTKYPVIAQIPAGTDVEVLNCGGGWKRDWCQIKSGGTTGFVAANTLAPDGNNNVEVAPVVTTAQANLHKGPGPNYKILGVVPGGATVNKGACTSGWARTWCQVNYNGQVGYVLAELLERQGALFP